MGVCGRNLSSRTRCDAAASRPVGSGVVASHKLSRRAMHGQREQCGRRCGSDARRSLSGPFDLAPDPLADAIGEALDVAAVDGLGVLGR